MRSCKNSLRTSKLSVEHLEQRVLLHAGHIIDVTPTNNTSGKLSAESELVAPGDAQQPFNFDAINPLEPVNYDEILGIPGGGSRGSVELPDFFPDIGNTSVDQTSQPGRTLVRFSTFVNNQGNGPAILISGRPGIDPIPEGAPIDSWLNEDGGHNVLQALYNFDGSSYSLSHYEAAGSVSYHLGHGHFHYDGYASYQLRHDVGGQPGDYVQRPDGSGAVGAKVGFCLINLSDSFTMENGQSSTTLPGYDRPGQPATSCGLLQGIHVGYADIYSSGISGQWLDVTDIPNGSYFIEIDLDDEDVVSESNEDNNAKTFAYDLNVNPTSGGIDPDIFDDGTNNNSFEDATDMGVLGTYTQTGLTAHWGQDLDFFKFEASSSGEYDITSAGNGDINIFLYDASETRLAISTSTNSSEIITYDFVQGETYYLKAQTYNSSTSSNYEIAWNLKPEASSLTDVAVAAEGGQTGKFIIARNGPVNTPLTVTFALTGDAENGVDYQAIPTSVTIGNLASQAEIEIDAIADGSPEGIESVILTITSDNAYVVGGTGSQLAITDISPDFNLDGSVGLPDIDMLTQNIAIGPADPATYDLTGDGLVDTDDLDAWLALAGATNLPSGNAYLLGDANLDGFVDGVDYLIWNSNKFTTNPNWSAANFNGDGLVDGADFITWNQNKFTSSAALPNIAVPVFNFSAAQREPTVLRSRNDAIDLALQKDADDEEWMFLKIVQR